MQRSLPLRDISKKYYKGRCFLLRCVGPFSFETRFPNWRSEMEAMLVSLVLYLYNASEVYFVKEKALFRLIKHAFSSSVLTNLHTYIYEFIARPHWVYQS